jgi:hypothetical protein
MEWASQPIPTALLIHSFAIGGAFVSQFVLPNLSTWQSLVPGILVHLILRRLRSAQCAERNRSVFCPTRYSVSGA